MARLFFISLFFTFSLLTSSLLGHTQNSSALNFGNGLDAWESEDSELNPINVLPCVPVNESVKQFKTDVLIVNRNFTKCSEHDSQYNTTVSTIIGPIELPFVCKAISSLFFPTYHILRLHFLL